MNSKNLHALIIDSDSTHNHRLEDVLQEHADISVTCAPTLAEGLDNLRRLSPHLIFVALDVNDRCGLDLLDEPGLTDEAEVVLMNAHDDPERVSRGIAAGASCFICKPCEPTLVEEVLRHVEDAAQDKSRTGSAAPVPRPLAQFGELRGASRPMRELFRTLRVVAGSDTSVLIAGASGTGKDLVASTIHQMSDRANEPYVAMNCGAVPQELIESELFGHEKGSFSGATSRHIGFFERADGGTLFLDEVTEMPIHHQVRFLRVLETGRFRRVGGEVDLAADVRIVAATNVDPLDAIRRNKLREDLYYRIAHFPIRIPPLRERTSDIEGLAQYFLQVFNDANPQPRSFSREALSKLQGYAWPGNVRQLQAVVERAALLATDVIGPEHVVVDERAPTDGSSNSLSIDIGTSVADAEKQLIQATLEHLDHNKTRTAEVLGVSLKTLYNRLKRFDDQARNARDGVAGV